MAMLETAAQFGCGSFEIRNRTNTQTRPQIRSSALAGAKPMAQLLPQGACAAPNRQLLPRVPDSGEKRR